MEVLQEGCVITPSLLVLSPCNMRLSSLSILRYPRAAASVVLVLNSLLLIWSLGEFDRPRSAQRILKFCAGSPLLLIFLFPTVILFFLLPRLSRKKRSLVNEIATGIILAAFVVTMAQCARTVHVIASPDALNVFFYLLEIYFQIALLLILSYINYRTESA